MTSLADLVLLWDAPLVLTSSPEVGLDDAQVMAICENLPRYFQQKRDFDKHWIIGCDYRGSSSGKFCKTRVRSAGEGEEPIHGDGKGFDLDLSGVVDDWEQLSRVERCKKSVEHSFWFCFWKGKVQGALTATITQMGDKPLPHHPKGQQDTVIPGVKLGQYDSDGLFINGTPPHTRVRVVVAVSIDGGPVTQVEKRYLPSICASVSSDLRRRGYSWAGHVTVVWCAFPSIQDLLKSLDGIRNLECDEDKAEDIGRDHGGKSLAFKVGGKIHPVNAPSILQDGWEDAMKGVAVTTDESMMTAAGAGDIDTVEYILSKKGNPLAKDSCATTAVQVAACQPKFQVVETLLQAGARPESRNAYDITPLGDAAERGHVRSCELLIAAKADINAKIKGGKSIIERCEEEKKSHKDKAPAYDSIIAMLQAGHA